MSVNISYDEFQQEILRGIQELKSHALNKSQLNTLKEIFSESIQNQEMKPALQLILREANKIQNPQAILQEIVPLVSNILNTKAKYDEFNYILGDYFEPENGIDPIPREELQDVFKTNLVTQLNKVLALKEGVTENLQFSNFRKNKSVSFEDKENLTLSHTSKKNKGPSKNKL